MRTAGIDLATLPRKTAVCVVEWSGSDAVVSFDEGCEDADLVNVCQKYDKIGIDCPFGWPVPFVDAIRTHADHAPWPGTGQPSQKTFRDLLAFRCTDQFVRARTKLNPLSVSSNFIGRTAMRCALLLDALGSVDRTGQCGTVAEVYPAASLREWRFEYKGYKKPKAYAKRGELLDRLDEEMRTLVWRDGSREWCIDSDHAHSTPSSARSLREPWRRAGPGPPSPTSRPALPKPRAGSTFRLSGLAS